ncbi:uncharacterized protein LOC756419 [Strongylocentrotus purpuratus]|uniref:Reverse transcriptase domain-containing protein n=1 Tax=Strongylocentrotus purpuratus TaxID=7668 RepID=A0A7M7NRB0_STRPU|nr:uncharacterized protein LOC756419 [Strongylocentrotus purpuratus]
MLQIVPGKDAASPKSYRPISLLCHTYKLFGRLILNRIAPFVDEHLIPEQAGFRPGKSCTGQLLNLTQFIEDGYESKLITGAAFVDLSAAYDTVNHRILTRKIFELTKDVRLTGLIQTLLSNRRYFVVLNGNRSRWRRQKNGLPQGSVLAPLLFNVYTNDQPIHPNTRSFLYADDLCIATQNQSFVKLEESLSDALAGLIPYYATNHLRANPDKTQISAFHLKNRDANHQLRISWYGKRLKHTPNPVYLGVTLDRSLTYKNHIANTKAKVKARNSILKKLANTNWGTDARTIRTTALALCFSAAEYASPVWSRSAHAPKIDPALNSACRAITGCLRPTKVEDIYLLCDPTLNNYLPGFQTLNLISPNYPESDYPDDADLSWIVTCEPSFKLLIMFDELDTEARSDILILGNGTDPDDYSTTLKEFSGVEFRRNITLDSEDQANIFSPDFPLDYPDNSDELWTISTPTNHLILLHFEKFVLEDVQYDSLTIGTGRHPSDADSKVIGVYGGSVVPNDIQSASPYLWLQFVSDGSVSVQGFWIVVSATRIEAQTTVTPTTDAGSSTLNATETPPPGSTTPEARSTMYPQPKSTTEGTLIPTTDPTFLPTTNPTSSQSVNPRSTRGLAPSKTSEGSTMSSAKGSTLILTSPWSTVSEVPGSNAPRTGNMKVVVSTVIISLLVLVGLLLLVVLWLVRRSRNSPPLVDDGGKDLGEDDNLHHINPAYEYQTIDHIVLNSTHHSPSNGENSIKKPLPRPPTDIGEEDDHRYSTYIDTTSEKMSSDLPMYHGSGGNENDRDSGCDESGIGIDEYHRYPHRGSNIGTGLDDLADIEYYGTSDFTAKSVDGQSDNEVYQEIPYDLETQEKQRSTDFGSDKMKVCDLSNELLKVGCSDDPRRSSSNSDAIAASLIENDLYIPMKQESDGHIYDDTSVGMGSGDGAYNVAGGDRSEEKWRKAPDAVEDQLYDDTAPLDETFYHIVTRNESDDEDVNEQIKTNPTQPDNRSSEEKWRKVSDAVDDELYDDIAPLDDTFYHVVTRNENDDENVNEQIQTNPIQPDNHNPANQIHGKSDAVEIPGNNDRVVWRNETVNDMDNDCDDASNEHAELEPVDDEAVDDPEYQIVDRNEIDDEIGEDIDTHGLDVDDAIDAGIMSTVMVDNELYRPLCIVEDSGNLEEENQTFQNDTVI